MRSSSISTRINTYSHAHCQCALPMPETEPHAPRLTKTPNTFASPKLRGSPTPSRTGNTVLTSRGRGGPNEDTYNHAQRRQAEHRSPRIRWLGGQSTAAAPTLRLRRVVRPGFDGARSPCGERWAPRHSAPGTTRAHARIGLCLRRAAAPLTRPRPAARPS